MPTSLMTASNDLTKVRRVNATDTSFPSRIPTKQAPQAAMFPSGPGTPIAAGSATLKEVINTRGAVGSQSANLLQLFPYGTGSDNNTFSLRVIAWHAVNPPNNDLNKNIYIPTTLCELAVTLSATIPGVAGCQVVDTELFADTITITTGDTSLVKLYSGANNTVAWAVIDYLGAPFVEVTFNINSGSTTDMNALFKTL